MSPRSHKAGAFDPPADPDRIDTLFERLETELADIETREILEGLSAEELEMQGFIGKKNCTVTRSDYSALANPGGYRFAEGVEYHIVEITGDIDSVQYEELEMVSPVSAGALVATKPLTGRKRPSDAASLFQKGYAEKARVRLDISEAVLRVWATVAGKVVLLNGHIYLVPIDRDATFSIEITADTMRACATISPARGKGKPVSAACIRERIAALGITAGINQETIDNLAGESLTATQPLRKIVARGEHPVHGADAPVQFMFDTARQVEDFKILPDGRVDYRKQANIQLVNKGDVLATIGKPDPGRDGYTVMGKPTPHTPGKNSVLTPGDNVVFSDDKTKLIAQTDGRASLNGNILHVYQHYTVHGDVDYAVGNINFGGNVSIHGSVLPGFEIRAAGDVLISGNVDNAAIDAGRDLKIAGGVLGADHTVSCGRNLSVHHLQNAAAEVQGDITIGDSCMHCTLHSTGGIVAATGKGVIVGGHIVALKGVRARTIGSTFGTKTVIEVGNDFLVRKKIEDFQKAIRFYEQNIDKIAKALAPLLALLKGGAILPPARNAQLEAIVQKRRSLLKHRSLMMRRKADLERLETSGADACIQVERVLYPDVIVRIRTITMVVREPLKRVTLLLDRKQQRIVSRPGV